MAIVAAKDVTQKIADILGIDTHRVLNITIEFSWRGAVAAKVTRLIERHELEQIEEVLHYAVPLDDDTITTFNVEMPVEPEPYTRHPVTGEYDLN